MDPQPTTSRSLVISYLVLRKAIGVLGIALPFVLVFGQILFYESGVASSISSYYYTGMRDVFVGFLCAIAVFLMSYKGYERKDDLAGDLACVFGVGVALFPTSPDVGATPLQQWVGWAHLAFAAAFFVTLAYISLCLFTKTGSMKPPTRKKQQRNLVYRACGGTMLGCLVLIALVELVPGIDLSEIKRRDPVFWLEALAIVAFGVSWLVKGEGILQDDDL